MKKRIGKKQKIFFVTTELPSRRGGAQVRNFNILKHLNKKKFDISLFTIIDKTTKKIQPAISKELGMPTYTVMKHSHSLMNQLALTISKKTTPYMNEYASSGLAELLVKRIKKEKPDIIHIEQLNTYYAIQEIIPYLKSKNIKIFFDQHNVEHVAFSEGIRSLSKVKYILGKIILPNIIHLEYDAIANTDYLFVCSDVDKKYFQNNSKIKNISVIPNGVDCNYFKTNKPVRENNILFMGGAAYPPNNEALKYYFSEVHSKIKGSIKDLSIYILGANPPVWLKKLAETDKSIHITNQVPDVREYINKAKVCICPIKSGSGTRLKILEYLASGKAVVSTSKGAEGIYVKHKKNILLADSANDFAQEIIELCQGKKNIKSLEKEGRKLILDKYQWKKNIKTMEEKYIDSAKVINQII